MKRTIIFLPVLLLSYVSYISASSPEQAFEKTAHKILEDAQRGPVSKSDFDTLLEQSKTITWARSHIHTLKLIEIRLKRQEKDYLVPVAVQAAQCHKADTATTQKSQLIRKDILMIADSLRQHSQSRSHELLDALLPLTASEAESKFFLAIAARKSSADILKTQMMEQYGW